MCTTESHLCLRYLTWFRFWVSAAMICFLNKRSIGSAGEPLAAWSWVGDEDLDIHTRQESAAATCNSHLAGQYKAAKGAVGLLGTQQRSVHQSPLAELFHRWRILWKP